MQQKHDYTECMKDETASSKDEENQSKDIKESKQKVVNAKESLKSKVKRNLKVANLVNNKNIKVDIY